MQRLQEKDASALQYLYDHYAAAIYGVIIRIVKSDAIAEEVLQDVFLKIWDRFQSYDPSKGRLFTWLVNVARNQAIDKTRSKEIVKANKTVDIENVVSIVNRDSFSETMVDSIGLTELLSKLNDDQRFVVEYLYLKGYSQAELAEEFGIPLGTVKTRLRMAMQTLRSILGLI